MTIEEYQKLGEPQQLHALMRAIHALNQCDDIDIYRERDFGHERKTGENVAHWELSGVVSRMRVSAHGRDLAKVLIEAGHAAESLSDQDYQHRAQRRAAALAKLNPEDRAILGLA